MKLIAIFALLSASIGYAQEKTGCGTKLLSKDPPFKAFKMKILKLLKSGETGQSYIYFAHSHQLTDMMSSNEKPNEVDQAFKEHQPLCYLMKDASTPIRIERNTTIEITGIAPEDDDRPEFKNKILALGVGSDERRISRIRCVNVFTYNDLKNAFGSYVSGITCPTDNDLEKKGSVTDTPRKSLIEKTEAKASKSKPESKQVR